MTEYAVFSRRILTGTISDLPPSARIAWIAVLFEAEKLRGRVKLPLRDLARMASITIVEAAEALRIFQEPDTFSSSKEHEGRRLLPVENEEDWYVVATWEKHAAERKAFFNRLRQQRHREKNVTPRNTASREVTKEPEPKEKIEPDLHTARAGAPDFEAAKRIIAKLDASALKRKPSDQIAIAWLGDFGEELIVETLADCERSYAGKGYEYFEQILVTRRDDPSQRPGQRRRKNANGRERGPENGRGDSPGGASEGEASPRKPRRDFGHKDGRKVLEELRSRDAERDVSKVPGKTS